MNLVGKIFTVLVFLMSIVFATFAVMVNAGHKNWRNEVVDPAIGLNKKLVDEVALKEKKESEKKQLEEAKALELDRQGKRLTAAENERERAIKEVQANEGEINKLSHDLRDAVAAMAAVHKTLSELRAEADAMRNQIKVTEAARNEAFNKLVKTTDDFHNAVNDRMRLDKQIQQLTVEVTKLREMREYFKIGDNFKDKSPPSGLEGEVTSVRPDFIEISVGADDGVRKGHKFEVVRLSNKSYVGRIEVVNADFPNRAVCRPDASMQRSQIQKGDHVYANLSNIK